MPAVRSAALAPGIEVKAVGSGVVSPHSKIEGVWYRPELGRDVWHWPVLALNWRHLARITSAPPAYGDLDITTADEADAREVMQCLRSGVYAKGIAALFTGEWPTFLPHVGDTSESSRDFQLVLAASHFVRDHPRRAQVLAALLWQTGWPQSRTRKNRKRNPSQYVAIVVANAIDARAKKREARLSDLALTLARSRPSALEIDLRSVLDPTLGMRANRVNLIKGIVAFAAVTEEDQFTRRGGWRRFPVQDFADLHGTSPESVRRALEDAKNRGLIERDVNTHGHDGRPRKDSLVRLVNPAALRLHGL